MWTFGIALLAAACTGSEDRPRRISPGDLPPPVTDSGTTTTLPAPPATAVAAPAATTSISPPASGVNRLVILDRDGNIVIIDPDGTDASIISDAFGAGAIYYQPIWSPASAEIAWGQAGPAGFTLEISGADAFNRRSAPMVSAPFYFYWAPDGSRIGALRNGPQGAIELEIVEVANAAATVVSAGSPFYFSWRPDAGAVVVHAGAGRFVIIDRDGDITDLGPTSADYQAPQWTPAGIIHLDEGELRLVDPDGDTRVLATVPGSMTFVANPQGTRIAVQAEGPGTPAITPGLEAAPAVPAGVVAVLDVATGALDSATSDLSAGFWWSPDGEKLLILEPADRPGHVDVTVWENGETRRLATFAPLNSFIRDVLRFFNQYAQSYQLWAPDSSAFAFAGDIDGERGVWVQSLDGSDPQFVGEGTWVAWSSG